VNRPLAVGWNTRLALVGFLRCQETCEQALASPSSHDGGGRCFGPSRRGGDRRPPRRFDPVAKPITVERTTNFYCDETCNDVPPCKGGIKGGSSAVHAEGFGLPFTPPTPPLQGGEFSYAWSSEGFMAISTVLWLNPARLWGTGQSAELARGKALPEDYGTTARITTASKGVRERVLAASPKSAP
jgi:hypothetical protein